MKTPIPDEERIVRRMSGFSDSVNARFPLEQLVRVGLRVVGADQGSLLLAEPKVRRLRFAMIESRGGEPVPDLVGKTVPIGEGVTGMAALTRDVQAASESDGAEFHRIRGDGRPHAVLAAPILLGETLLGVMTAVSFDRRKAFSPDDIHTYGMLANVAAAVIGAQHDAGLEKEGEEAALLDDVRSFVHARHGRIHALRSVLAALADMP